VLLGNSPALASRLLLRCVSIATDQIACEEDSTLPFVLSSEAVFAMNSLVWSGSRRPGFLTLLYGMVCA
jgi:hypothetical protein